ncbi:MAG: hypothetical protein KJZ65_03800 [Phycisphaerales bacterium]|nr:hypothetical protein [Phycisphaerales bacterium]
MRGPEERRAAPASFQSTLEERQSTLEERQSTLEERQSTLEERQIALEERQITLEERHIALEERQIAQKRRVTRVGGPRVRFLHRTLHWRACLVGRSPSRQPAARFLRPRGRTVHARHV